MDFMRHGESNTHCQICQICQIAHNDSPLHVVVSTLANVTSKVVAKDVCLYDWLTNPKEEHQPIITAIRNETDIDHIKALKKQLPVVIPSGEYFCRNTLFSYSKLICIDIDYKDNSNYTGFDQLKTDLFPKFDSIAYGGSSVSGKGYFLLFVNDDENKHLETFHEIECAFHQHGIKIDTSKKNINDLRFYSIDPDPYINEYATSFKSIYCPQIANTWKAWPSQPNLPLAGPESLIKYLDKALSVGKPLYFEYGVWWRLACGLFNELGESGRIYFHMLSAMEPEKYNPSKTDRTFNNAKKYTEIKAGSVVHIIKDAGGP
jgi:hypothetical protein